MDISAELPKLDIDTLLDTYQPTEDTFDVILPLGEVLKFKPLPRYGEAKQFNRAMMAWAAKLPMRGSNEAAGHPWADDLPVNSAEAIAAFTISELSVEPKIAQRDALRLMKAPKLIDHIISEIESKSKTMESVFLSRLVQEAKKNSSETLGEELSSL